MSDSNAMPVESAGAASSDLRIDYGDGQVSRRTLRDVYGSGIDPGEYLLLRLGSKPIEVVITEGDNCDLWLRLKSDCRPDATQQRVDELASDVVLIPTGAKR